MKNSLLIFFIFLFTSTSFSQVLITDPDLDTLNPLQCNIAPPVFFDSGSNTANYGPNENETIVICPDYAASTTKTTITIGGAGVAFDIDISDTIFVYDGLSTSAPLLGAHNSTISPTGFVHIASFNNNPFGCLTVNFVSDAIIEGNGWEAAIGCIQPAQPFELHMDGYLNGTNIITPLDTGYADICLGDAILFVASAIFPYSSDSTGLGYSQNNSNVTYEWAFSDGTVAFTDSVWFTPPARNGYIVSLKATDQFPSSQTISSKVRVSTIPSFAGVILNRNEICVLDTTLIIGAVTNSDTTGVSPTTSSFPLGGSVAGLVPLPDKPPGGSPINHYDTIQISGFTPGATVTNVTDLQQLCLNMEHSYLGDLEMLLTCPNGTSISIFNVFGGGGGIIPGGFGGGGTYLGHPLDALPNGVPGIGEDYCWSSSLNTYGDFPTEFAAGNIIAVAPPASPSAGNSMSWNGIYAPEESFINLVGCPLNGSWSITIRDNLTADDGFIFEWSIIFDPLINPNSETYAPVIDTSFWHTSATILPGLPSDTFIIVSSSNPGIQNYTFEVTDNFGCTYDTTVSVNFIALPDIHLVPGANTVCQGTPVNFDVTGASLGNTSYSWSPSANLSNSLIANPVLTTNTMLGLTTFTLTATDSVTGCTVDSTQIITVDTGYTFTATQSDTNICVGDVINFTAIPNPTGSYFYSWSTSTNINVFSDPDSITTAGTFSVAGIDTVIIFATNMLGPLGCVRLDTMYVNTTLLPIINDLTADTQICINGNMSIFATGQAITPTHDLFWNNGLVGYGPHSIYPTANTTTYEVYAIDENNCSSDTQNIVVTLFPPITINAINLSRDTICEGDTTLITVNATGGGTDLFYSWSDASGTVLGITSIPEFIITPINSGDVYTVIISDSCTTPIQNISITSIFAPTIIPSYTATDIEGCYDVINPNFTNTTPNFNVKDSIFWDFNDGNTVLSPFSTSISHTYDKPGLYNTLLTVTDLFGCHWTISMPNYQVIAHSYPSAKFSWNPDPTNYLNAKVTFNNLSTDSYFNEWTFTTDVQSTSNIVNPTFTFPQNKPGDYNVLLKVTNEGGCEDEINKTVVIDDVFLFYIPTAFTPDGDGLNEVFKAVTEGIDLSLYSMKIYNKWGEILFSTSDPKEGWNGIYNGTLVQSGVYVWKVEAKETHSSIVHKKEGFVTVLK